MLLGSIKYDVTPHVGDQAAPHFYLLDANGTPLHTNGGNGIGGSMSAFFSPLPGFVPKTFAFRFYKDPKDVLVPYEFRDIPLPK